MKKKYYKIRKEKYETVIAELERKLAILVFQPNSKEEANLIANK